MLGVSVCLFTHVLSAQALFSKTANAEQTVLFFSKCASKSFDPPPKRRVALSSNARCLISGVVRLKMAPASLSVRLCICVHVWLLSTVCITVRKKVKSSAVEECEESSASRHSQHPPFPDRSTALPLRTHYKSIIYGVKNALIFLFCPIRLPKHNIAPPAHIRHAPPLSSFPHSFLFIPSFRLERERVEASEGWRKKRNEAV